MTDKIGRNKLKSEWRNRWQLEKILTKTTQTAITYLGSPLSTLNTKTRGDILEKFARHVDEMIMRLTTSDAIKNGKRTCEYDYLRNMTRVEVKSGQLCWNGSGKHWFVKFRDIKPGLYDELCLVLYTPKALYIFKHDSVGLTTNGKLSKVKGLYLNYNAPRNMIDWETALEYIISNIGKIFYTWSFM